MSFLVEFGEEERDVAVNDQRIERNVEQGKSNTGREPFLGQHGQEENE